MYDMMRVSADTCHSKESMKIGLKYASIRIGQHLSPVVQKPHPFEKPHLPHYNYVYIYTYMYVYIIYMYMGSCT